MISNSYAIIFDLDGTLVHSIPDMHIAINKTLNEYHLQNISEEKLQTFVGEGMLSLSKKVVDFCGGDKNYMIKFIMAIERTMLINLINLVL